MRFAIAPNDVGGQAAAVRTLVWWKVQPDLTFRRVHPKRFAALGCFNTALVQQYQSDPTHVVDPSAALACIFELMRELPRMGKVSSARHIAQSSRIATVI